MIMISTNNKTFQNKNPKQAAKWSEIKLYN